MGMVGDVPLSLPSTTLVQLNVGAGRPIWT